MIVKSFVFNMFGVNTYLLIDDDTKECAIVDPGMMNDAENKKLSDYIEENKLTPIRLINTHLHIDHVLGNRYVYKLYGLSPNANESDYFLGQRIEAQAEMFGLNIEYKSNFNYTNLTESDTIQIGKSLLSVIHVPGHSPGSIVLHCSEDKFIISGDVLFYNSIGRTDLPGGDYGSLINGIKNKILCLDEDTIVYPGHGPATTIKEEKVNNPYL